MATSGEAGAARAHHGLRPYVQMARVDHWFKNAFMLAGVILALFVEPALLRLDVVPVLLLALLSTCLVASSNYVLNEMLDAPYDRKHPVKKHRPAAAEKVRRRYALAEWLALGALGDVQLAVGLGPASDRDDRRVLEEDDGLGDRSL